MARSSKPGSNLRGFAVFACLALATAAFFHLRSPNVPDPDSFYHYRHADLYRTNGLVMTAFPWIAWSIIRVHAADIWYGFHLLLVPFTAISNELMGIKLAGIALTTLLLVSARSALARMRVGGASFWPFLLLVAGPNVLLHFTMMRPHVLTTALCALLFAFLVTQSAWGSFLTSLALAFFHLSLIWMIPVVAVVVFLARLIVGRAGSHPLSVTTVAPSRGLDSENPLRSVGSRPLGGRVSIAQAQERARFDWRPLLAAVAGMLLGAILRPNPFGALEIAYVQIIEHTLIRKAGVLLLVGKELFPITGDVVALNFIPFLVLWIGAGVAVLVLAARGRISPFAREGDNAVDRDDRDQLKIVLFSSAALSLLFFGMMLFIARRSFAPWALFSVIFMAAAMTLCGRRGKESYWGFSNSPGTLRQGAAAMQAAMKLSNAEPSGPGGTPVDTLMTVKAGPSPAGPAAPTLEARGTDLAGDLGLSRPWSAVVRDFKRQGRSAQLMILGIGVLFTVMLVHATIRNRRNLDNAYPIDACRGAAEWIEAHSRPGDIVFNVHWDSFPLLFFWNRTNRYVHGMDPIFLYAYDPSLYYDSFYIQIQKATAVTCGQAHCTAETVQDTFTVLKRDFHARWLFVEKERTPGFFEWVRKDPRFVPGYENATQAVFGLE